MSFHSLDRGVSLEFPGSGPAQPRPESASRLRRNYSFLALETPLSLASGEKCWGGGEGRGVSVSATKVSISEGIPSIGKAQPQPKQ